MQQGGALDLILIAQVFTITKSLKVPCMKEMYSPFDIFIEHIVYLLIIARIRSARCFL